MALQRSITSILGDNRITRPIKKSIIRTLASRAPTRALLNRYFNSLPPRAAARFQERYWNTFHDHSGAFTDGVWNTRFAGNVVRLPLRETHAWLDWDTAVSITSHDIEIKQLYETLICDSRVDLFIDIGANNGTHSLLFLAAGIRTVSFEPNPECREYVDTTCGLNGLVGQWEAVALGEKPSTAYLSFPPKLTFLGHISDEPTGHQVQVTTLDSYLHALPKASQVLVKIDTEGHETNVVEGASATIEKLRPTVIFEANDKPQQIALFSAFARHGYKTRPMRAGMCCTNFIAEPS